MTRSPGAASAAAGARSHRLRIVGGQWKRTPIAVPDVAGLRPTPDRVRETLFNWLGQKLGARRCLDLFAGTGALGFEAASRGAEQVVLVERDRRAAAAIAATIERLRAPGVRLVVGDAFDALNRLAQSGERFDVVFVDPPFDQALHARALAALAPVLAENGLVYVESGEAFDAPAGWRIEREGRAGQVRYHLLSRQAEASAADASPGTDA
ncbi:MAG: 16S rRNA (guanine(966)-N(2))-methyltransferase RsmD [Burkholderiaceae bacterium]|nr:16S rRNA (guanine(966)-N(2))-methyltransferase RsmD [Burkholderiaceae bacterium]